LFIVIVVAHVVSPLPFTDCRQWTAVPGSQYNYAYGTRSNFGSIFDIAFCSANLHPMSSLVVYRDSFVAEWIGINLPWGWIGLVYNTSTNSLWWVDGKNSTERPVISKSTPGPGLCAESMIYTTGEVFFINCSSGIHISICELPCEFLYFDWNFQ
jgi:hypothetical protein